MAQVMMVELYHLCAPKRIHLQVSHVTPMLVVPTPSHFSSPPQHAATSGPRELLQDNTVHRQALPQESLQPLPEQLSHEPLPANAIRSENNAEQSLSDPEYKSAGKLGINTSTGYEPKEFTTEEIATTPMMSREEDIYQLYDVQREFGEQAQQALVVEETRGFGQIQVQSLLGQEMARMSPIKKMSCLQSRMHVDGSMESNADSDLEDGEIRKLLTSSLCPWSFCDTRCDGLSGKRGKCTNVSFIRRSGSYRETGCIVFHQNVMNRETKGGVLCSETLMCRISVKLCSKAIKITC